MSAIRDPYDLLDLVGPEVKRLSGTPLDEPSAILIVDPASTLMGQLVHGSGGPTFKGKLVARLPIAVLDLMVSKAPPELPLYGQALDRVLGMAESALPILIFCGDSVAVTGLIQDADEDVAARTGARILKNLARKAKRSKQ